MAENNFYNNYFIFNMNYINRLLSTSFVLIWTICYVFTQPLPQPKNPNPNNNSNRFINQFISSKGVGLGFISFSMLMEIVGDLITINANTISTDAPPEVGFSSLILWNFSLAMKSFAVFIALTRYLFLANALSKEPIMSQNIYNFSIYFNLLSGIMIYPSLVCVLVLYRTTWSQSMLITEFYYMFQMSICLVFFFILNRGIYAAIDQGVLVDRFAIQKFRMYRSRNLFVIGFLFLEVISLFIFNLNQMAGKFIQGSFGATAVVLGLLLLSNSAVYVIAVTILSLHVSEPDSNLPNGKNHTLSDFTTVTVKEPNNPKAQGFSSRGLGNIFKKHNHAAPLEAYTIPNKGEGEFQDVELGENDEKK